METLKDIPVSKLIFYETYPEKTYHNKEEVSIALRRRLLNDYRLDKEKAASFIERERIVFLKREDDFNGFLFEKNFEDSLEQFYQMLCISKEKMPINNIYSNVVFSYIKGLDFSWSEYLKLYQLFCKINISLQFQMKEIRKEYKKNIKKQLHISCDTIEFKRLAEINNKLIEEIHILEEKQDFYESLIGCIFIEIVNNEMLIDYLKDTSFFSSILMRYIIYKETKKLEINSDCIKKVEIDYYNKLKQLSKKR